MSDGPPIADERTPPFFYTLVDATALIRSQFRRGEKGGSVRMVPLLDDDPGLAQVLAVYTALEEVANEARARGAVGESDSAGFTAERRKLVAYSGASESTVKRVVAFLERIRLVRVEVRRRAANRNLPNRYVLLQPLGSRENPTPVQGDPQGGVQGGPEQPQEPGPTQEPTGQSPAGDGGDEVAAVHAHFVATFGKTGKAAELRPDERKIIRDALGAGTADELRTCITACERSDYHMRRGEHEHRKGGRYNSLGKILKPRPRNGETQRSRIEWWLERAEGQGDAPAESAGERMNRLRQERLREQEGGQ